ncbi:alpha/beta hydrolase [Nisaea acidiphila]|uniref:Alpha/beta hydrolase n=1 Tax=Nisaea acidiphila TaxID=1862145 RepID=A0A9J7ATE8_9PROT|nr:alpha/beta hydrolase [Nisaea acidiphila]UUX50575.1 alpha/beta hydrolase [Nisaea acidiphila]
MSQDPERKRADTAAGHVSYREAGDGAGKPVLLALHGLGGNSATWRAQYAALSDSWHVIGWDAPGYGETMVVGPDQTAFATLALALLDHLGVGSFSVIGHSMGGVVAQAIAGEAGPRVNHMILSCTHSGNAKPASEPISGSYATRIAALEKEGSAAYAANRSGMMVAEGAPEAVRAEVEEIARGVTAPGLRTCATMLHHADTRPVAPSISCPVLLISGAGDKIVTLRQSESLAALYPAGRHVRLEGVGHAPYLEDVDAYNALLREFLAS